MYLERIVIDIVLLFSAASFASIANVTALVLVSAMCVQLIVSIEALSAEAALGMAFETTLVNCAGIVIAKLLVLFQVLRGEELVLMREHLFVPCTQITTSC